MSAPELRNFINGQYVDSTSTDRFDLIDPATGQRGFRYEGIIDWPGQIEALARDGYTGFVSIEPHERPKIALARRYVERLRGAGVRP